MDVETTGLSHQDDEIIELAMLPFDYDSESCEIHQVYNQQAFSKLREPSRSIPEHITQINGITNEMVQGHKIEAEEVEEIVKQTKINNFLIGESLLKDLDEKTSLLHRILKISP